MKRIAILGSTGSIGKQTLEVISLHPEEFTVEVLTAQNNADLLIDQAKKHKPNCVIIGDENNYNYVKNALQPLDIKVFAGRKSIVEIVEMETIDIVLTALVGYAGLEPTINAIKHKKNIALANKETLVVAGELITKMALQQNIFIAPVDSEHSAIFQCITGEFMNPIEKIFLTASGGPFRGKKISDLSNVGREEALNHPNWSMGAKISIDSATLMNKGLEMIEAKWLFNLTHDQIEVVVHPQSIIHSIVQFEDGSMKAQMGLPDMKLPIQYALSYPKRLKSNYPRFSFTEYPTLTFEKADTKTFRNLALAEAAMIRGGNSPCILNAANEIAVEAFLKEQISFLKISEVIEECLEKVFFTKDPALEDYFKTDESTRILAKELIN
ncbi:MAG: 1-deoxy-D-xylulose-5-phosphate reductoisomerase [Bacteroidia bacterium]